MSNGRRSAWPTILAIWATLTIIGTIGLIVIYFIQWPVGWWEMLFVEGDFYTRDKYLLSATAQVLGALFALVFSITLIATQFVTKYTHRTMEIIFNKRVITYMAGFAVAVILPLWFLRTPTVLGALISLTVGSLYVLSLVGFFADLRKRMDMKWILDHFKKEGIKALKIKREENEDVTKEELKINYEPGDYGLTGLYFLVNKTAEEKVTAIDNIAMGAYTDKNYEVFRLAEMALLDFAMDTENYFLKLPEKSVLRKKAEELHKLIFRMLRDTLEETKENPRAPILVVRQVGKTGSEAIKNVEQNLVYTWFNSGKLLKELDSLYEGNTEDKIAISTQCDVALYNIAMAGTQKACDSEKTEEDEINTYPYFDFLYNYLVQTYEKRLGKNWAEWQWAIRDNRHRIENLLRKFAPEASYYYNILFPLYLKYTDTSVKNKDPFGGHSFQRTIKVVFPKEIENAGHSQIVCDHLPSLAEHTKKFYEETNTRDWKGLWEWVLKYSIGMTNYSLTKEDKGLFMATQISYLETISSRLLDKSYFLTYFPQFITQTQKAIEKDMIANDEKWRVNIGKAIRGGTIRLLKTYNVNQFSQIWDNIKSLSKTLLGVSVSQGWIEPLEDLTKLFWHIIFQHVDGQLKHHLSDSEKNVLFRFGWLTFVVYHTPLKAGMTQVGLNLARQLDDKGTLQDFLEMYSKTKDEASDLKIPEGKWDSALSLFERRAALL